MPRSVRAVLANGVCHTVKCLYQGMPGDTANPSFIISLSCSMVIMHYSVWTVTIEPNMGHHSCLNRNLRPYDSKHKFLDQYMLGQTIIIYYLIFKSTHEPLLNLDIWIYCYICGGDGSCMSDSIDISKSLVYGDIFHVVTYHLKQRPNSSWFITCHPKYLNICPRHKWKLFQKTNV